MVYAFGGASAAAAASASRSCAEPLALWPRNNRVAANSPSLCPTMFSVMYTGMNLFPLCTFFFSSRRRHAMFRRDGSSVVCSSDLLPPARRPRRHRQCRRTPAARHEDFDHRIIPDDREGPHRHTEAPSDEAQGPDRGLPGERHGCARQAADGRRDRKRIANRAPLPGGEEGHVGGYAELSAAPDGLTGGLDVLHAALRVPPDEDAPDLRCPGLSGVHRLDAGVAQSLPHANAPEDQRPPDAAALHVIRRDAGGRNHLLVIDGESDL